MPVDLLADIDPVQGGPQDLLANVEPIAKKNDPSFLANALDAVQNTIIGAGDTVNNTARKLGNLVMPNNRQAPMLHQGEGLAYTGGGVLGDLATFGAGGGALNAARTAAESLPIVGRTAQALGGEGASGVARRMVGSGLYGAAENPNNKVEGALGGAALSGLLEKAPALLDQIRPKKYMEHVYQSVADGLRAAKGESRQQYGQVMDNFGNQPIILNGIDPDIFAITPRLKKMYSNFQDDPSIYNAHRLQSQIGAEDRKLGNKDAFTQDRKNALQESRENIVASIKKTLGSKFPEAAQAYENATNHYRQNVIPYELTNRYLRKITDPTAEKVTRKLDAITKLDAYPKQRVEDIDYSLVPKHIQDLNDTLSKRIRNRNLAQMAGGGILGGAMGTSAEVGALLGRTAPALSRRISSYSKGDQAKNALGGMLSKLHGNVAGAYQAIGGNGNNIGQDLLKSALLNMYTQAGNQQ